MARALAGFGNANIGTAQAIIADVTTPENRAKGMALIGIAFGLGFLLGPAIGGLLGQISPTAPFIGAGILALFNLFFAFFLLPETKSFSSKPIQRRIFPFTAFTEAKKYVNVRALLIVSFIYTTGFSLMEQAISLYIEHIWVTDPMLTVTERLQEAGLLTAYFLIVVGITAIIVQGGLVGRLQRMMGEVKMTQVGLLLTGVSIGCIPIIGPSAVFPLFLLIGIPLAFGTGMLNPAKTALLSRSIPTSEQGSILGLNQSFSALGRVVGPTFSGFFFDIFVELPFYTSVILFGLGLLMASSLQTPSLEESTPT